MNNEFKQICKKAYEHLKDNKGITGICSIKDIGDGWLFEGGDPSVTNYALNPIVIDKETHEIRSFEVSIENLRLLKKAINVDIPKEYSFKAS